MTVHERLLQMVNDGRADDLGEDGEWHGFCVDDPGGHDEKGIGIQASTIDPEDVNVHDWHGSGVYAHIEEAKRILDMLDKEDRRGC